MLAPPPRQGRPRPRPVVDVRVRRVLRHRLAVVHAADLHRAWWPPRSRRDNVVCGHGHLRGLRRSAWPLLLMVLTVTLALARRGLVTGLRRALPYVQRVSGGIMVLMGAYLTWYGIYEIRLLQRRRGRGRAAPSSLVTGWSCDVSERLLPGRRPADRAGAGARGRSPAGRRWSRPARRSSAAAARPTADAASGTSGDGPPHLHRAAAGRHLRRAPGGGAGRGGARASTRSSGPTTT